MIGLFGISFIAVSSYLYVKLLASCNDELEETNENTQTKSKGMLSRFLCKSKKT